MELKKHEETILQLKSQLSTEKDLTKKLAIKETIIQE